MTRDPETVVHLPRDIAAAMVRHARAERPNEACGLVVGSGVVADGGVPRRYVACRNQAASPSRFVVHRDDLLGALAELDRSGEELWGVVHSHVRTAAVPSSTDVAEAAWPAAVHLLVSLAGDPDADDAGPVIRAWRITEGRASELGLVTDADDGAAPS